MSDGASIQLSLLMNGHVNRAIRKYRSALRDHPDDKLVLMELACILAAEDRTVESSTLIESVELELIDSRTRARLETARAYLESIDGDSVSPNERLIEATRLDPDFPLAHLSLGRQALFLDNDPSMAQKHLFRAQDLAPNALMTNLGLVSLYSETGDYKNALKASWMLLRNHPLRFVSWMTFWTSVLLGTPLKGRLLVALISILVFLPNAVPVILGGWIVFSIASFIRLRKISPRLAMYPSLVLVILLLTTGMRWLVRGTLIP